jgi:hypothetical protein
MQLAERPALTLSAENMPRPSVGELTTLPLCLFHSSSLLLLRGCALD